MGFNKRKMEDLAQKSRAQGGDIAVKLHPGATQDFDDPGRKRQSVGTKSGERSTTDEWLPGPDSNQRPTG
jgi:hypothetical protein